MEISESYINLQRPQITFLALLYYIIVMIYLTIWLTVGCHRDNRSNYIINIISRNNLYLTVLTLHSRTHTQSHKNKLNSLSQHWGNFKLYLWYTNGKLYTIILYYNLKYRYNSPGGIRPDSGNRRRLSRVRNLVACGRGVGRWCSGVQKTQTPADRNSQVD